MVVVVVVVAAAAAAAGRVHLRLDVGFPARPSTEKQKKEKKEKNNIKRLRNENEIMRCVLICRTTHLWRADTVMV